MTPDTHPPLDERAVEAAARQRFHEAMRGDKDWTWASVTEDTREAYREAERRARAVYFAALDRAEIHATISGALIHYEPVASRAAEMAHAVVLALGLFIPDTKEPT